ncbi:MAG: nucleotide exchange factor GrpE [Verrucomicrobiota bacterium]
MPHGDKTSHTDKQKRQAAHTAAGYEKSGVSVKDAEGRAWATLNEPSGGAKKNGSGRKQHELKQGQSMNTQFSNPTPTAPDPDATAETAVTEFDALLKDLAEQKDLHLRLAADFENFKRRSRQESEARAIAQKESFIVELLPVIDNLERALASGASRDSAQFHQGVEMTLKQLQQLLRQHGIESEEIVGKPFDPHRQEALSQGHDPQQPDHAILEVVQRGYRKGAKVVRPAKVVVNDLTLTKPARHGR